MNLHRSVRVWNHRAVVAITFTIALLIVGAVHVGAQSSDTLIRIGVGPDDPSAPLIYADQAGLFKKAGLNVELLKLAGSSVIGAALAGGALEIGKGSPAPVIAAHSKGLPFTIIGSIANYTSSSPDDAFVVAGTSSIRSAKDLVGQTLAAVTLKDIGALSTFAWLDQQGVDWKSIHWVEMPASAMVAAMEDKRIAGAPIYEPALSANVATGKVRILGYPFDAIAQRFPEAVLFANTSWVNEHPDLVNRFLVVMRGAATYVGAHERDVAPIVARFSGIDPVLVANIRHPMRTVTIVPSELQPLINILAQYDLIPKAFPAQEMICTCALRR